MAILFSERKVEGQSPLEVLWTGVVLLACSLFDKIELEPEYRDQDGHHIPARYWRGLSVNGSVVNLSAFTDGAIHGRNPRGDGVAAADDYIVVRCSVERQVKKQWVFHPAMKALRHYLAGNGDRFLWVGLHAFKAVLEAYPDSLGDGRPVQEEFVDFINPRFGPADEPFMSDEQLAQMFEHERDRVERLIARMADVTFQQEYNPVRFDSCSQEEFLEALRSRQLYELRFQGNKDIFNKTEAESVFSVLQKKAFDLRYYQLDQFDRPVMKEWQSRGLFKRRQAYLPLEKIGRMDKVKAVVSTSPILIHARFVAADQQQRLLDAFTSDPSSPSVLVAFVPADDETPLPEDYYGE